MGTYRAYLLDHNEHIIRAHVLEAQDDEAARMEARQYLDGHDIEIWDAERPVAKLRHYAPPEGRP
ncbi:hypothetical protein SAMN05443247_03917 [Bradyrhizobium erythrophlei]|jgi:hypothetical protein|nr:hypothetical protein SAMN05443247_03917 [Bradyrhizobium erythrophlei]